jgi:hypothetical protein
MRPHHFPESGARGSRCAACLLELPGLLSFIAVQKFKLVPSVERLPRIGAILGAAVLCASIVTAPCATLAQEAVPSQTLRNVAGIVAHRDGRSVPIGTAFFVAVPSRTFEGRSFIYLVTAHHNLLDAARKPATGLSLTVEDKQTGAMREEALPPESRWVLDPTAESADVAAVPFNPASASIAPIPLSSLLGAQAGSRTIAETGAQAYYLMAASVGAARPRFEALARFGRVSLALSADTDVPGAGPQQLCFLDGGSTPGFSSGAPVFVQDGLSFALWGILEANTGESSNPMFAGLAGVLPANYVAATVRAMAAAQEKGLRKQ